MRNFSGKFRFSNHSKNNRRLVIIVAGYFPAFWSVSLNRVPKFQPSDTDVCIVSPGLYSAELEQYCRNYHWSYLSTKANKLALAQNIAIELHPNAEWIYKLDEDIVVGDGYFEGLANAWDTEVKKKRYNIGFIAPTLNVNGCSYIPFLRSVGAEHEYTGKFGEFLSACMGVKAHYSGEAARFIWEKTGNFDSLAHEFRQNAVNCSIIPHRFSIGAILIHRDFWMNLGGFRASIRAGVLGLEEKHLCMECIDHSRVMLLANNVLAGHYAFGPQRGEMNKILNNLCRDLAVATPEIL